MTRIEIVVTPRIRLLKQIVSFAYIVVVIGVGVALDSQAMQWMGFVILVITGLSIAISASRKNVGLTIGEARKRLDEIEMEGDA